MLPRKLLTNDTYFCEEEDVYCVALPFLMKNEDDVSRPPHVGLNTYDNLVFVIDDEDEERVSFPCNIDDPTSVKNVRTKLRLFLKRYIKEEKERHEYFLSELKKADELL